MQASNRMIKGHELRDEKGSTIIEYVLILPVILFLTMLLINMMFISYEKAVLDSASSRGAIYAKKIVVDPQYEYFESQKNNSSDYIDFESVDGFVNESNFDRIMPYRYFKLNHSDIETSVKRKIRDIINKTSFIVSSEKNESIIDVNVNITNAIIYMNVEIEVIETYRMPTKIFGLELGDVTLKSHAHVIINDPDEFIRNVDLAKEIIEDTGIDDKVSEMFKKVKDIGVKFFDFKE